VPLASSRKLEIEQSRELDTDGGPTAVELVHHLVSGEPASSTIVLCTHREIIVEILPALAAEYGTPLEHRLPGAKGGCWTLLFRDETLDGVKYWRPES
jgi:hypothetical protein